MNLQQGVPGDCVPGPGCGVSPPISPLFVTAAGGTGEVPEVLRGSWAALCDPAQEGA
ncbi:MAG TPA: hypothetical protein VFN35_03050 [Ktedonobacteraceae bacterium]|nr:hypothetical protein [Ktedonobacteraceae bacterium]